MDIEILKRAIELDLKLSLEEKAEVLNHLESGKYDMRKAVHQFRTEMDSIMRTPTSEQRGQRIARALETLERACGL